MSARGIKPIQRAPSPPALSWQRRAYLAYVKGEITAIEYLRAITGRQS